MPRDAASRTANVGTVGINGLRWALSWVPIMPRGVSLSASCTPDRRSFSRLVGTEIAALCGLFNMFFLRVFAAVSAAYWQLRWP